MDYTSLILSSISFLVGLATIKFAKPTLLRLVIVILGITVLTETLSLKIPNNEVNNLYNIFSFFDMGIWFLVYYRIHKKEKAISWILLAEVFVLIFSLVESYYDWGHFHTWSLRLYNIVIIFFSVLYLYRLLFKEYYEISKDPVFFICVACILYHSLSFIKFTTISEFVFFKDRNAANVFFTLDAIANILYYLFLCVAFIVSFYCQRKYLQSYRSL